MPLDKSGSKKAFANNVSKLRNEGRDLKQSLAIAYKIKGEKKAPK